MNDIRILENLFNNKQDEITFQNLEESNIISLNNNNKGDYSNNKLLFNSVQISKKMIDYSKAYILFEVKATIPFVNNDNNNDNATNHELTFKFPIFLKDINNFFRKIDIINFGEFDIQMTYKTHLFLKEILQLLM